MTCTSSPPGNKSDIRPVKALATQVLLLLLPVLAQAAPHNLVLFVPDGLRSQVVGRTRRRMRAAVHGITGALPKVEATSVAR
jgi:hypothetical protein